MTHNVYLIFCAPRESFLIIDGTHLRKAYHTPTASFLILSLVSYMLA